jgi:hypothetical protein
LPNGTDAQLTAALCGTQSVNAAEIIRHTYSGWNTTEIDKFSTMILDVFYPPASQTTPSATQEYLFDANLERAGENAVEVGRT